MIECHGLSKTYGSHKALHDLNLRLESGDAFGFIGPNGAGKTTTIRILSTLLDPTEGDALVGGFSVVREPDEVRRVLGYMPDHFGIYDGMRAWEYLDFFAAAYRVPRSQRKKLIGDVLELTDLQHKKDAFVEALSTGMRQRLCLAKTLLHDPSVLVLDEPASGLDPRARIELKELIRELTRMGKTLFVSSHILPELADFCTKVGILECGRLLASGSVEEILGEGARARRVRVRVLGDAEAAGAWLQAREGVAELAHEPGEKVHSFRFALTGDLEQLADLFEGLSQTGLRPIEFAEEKTDLEQVFLQVTTGAVA